MDKCSAISDLRASRPRRIFLGATNRNSNQKIAGDELDMSLAKLGILTLVFATMVSAQRGGAVGRPLAGRPNGGLAQRAGVPGWGMPRFFTSPHGWERGSFLCHRAYPRYPWVYPVWNAIPFSGGDFFPAPPDYTDDYYPPDYNQEPAYPPVTPPPPAAAPQWPEANQADFPARDEPAPAPAPSEMRLYRWVSQPYDSNDEYPSMIGLKNGGMYTVVKYWTKGTVLNFITTQGDHMRVGLDQVDRIYPSSNRNKAGEAAKH